MGAGKIIAALLALLGFAGCEIVGGRVEYGTPHASFEVKGRVTDGDGDPIRDIKIVVDEGEQGNPDYPLGVGITDASGRYVVIGSWFGGRNLTVVTEDIDGEANGGEFASKSVEIEIDSDDYVGGDGWYRGKAAKTADFTLTLKPQDDESK